MPDNPGDITLQVTALLEELQIDYVIAGSLASSIYGPYRATQDSDLVADIRPHHVAPLVERLRPEFYVSPPAIVDALAHRGSFNLVHLPTSYKVDIFLPKERAFDRERLRRGRPATISLDPPRTAIFGTAEDTILAKLEWYRLGGESSERQWNDVLGILRVQGDRLDGAYPHKMAAALGVADLLTRAGADVSSI